MYGSRSNRWWADADDPRDSALMQTHWRRRAAPGSPRRQRLLRHTKKFLFALVRLERHQMQRRVVAEGEQWPTEEV